MAKNGHVQEGGKVVRSNATPTNLFSIDSYDLKSMSFKFGNDIFINFEMPRSLDTGQFFHIRPSFLKHTQKSRIQKLSLF